MLVFKEIVHCFSLFQNLRTIFPENWDLCGLLNWVVLREVLLEKTIIEVFCHYVSSLLIVVCT